MSVVRGRISLNGYFHHVMLWKSSRICYNIMTDEDITSGTPSYSEKEEKDSGENQ